MTSVADLMHPGLISCGPDAPMGDIARILVECGVHALVVVDEAGTALGVVADSDLVAGEWLAQDEESLAAMRAMTAGELMTAPSVTIAAEEPVEQAAAVLHGKQLSRLVVTDQGRPVGVIAISDLVAQVAHYPTKRRTVADVMSYGFLACRQGAPVGAVARAMHERRSRSAVVLDASGRAVGVVTGRDLLPMLFAETKEAKVDALMSAPHTIAPSASLGEAADRMLGAEIHRLVVVAEDAPVPRGVISAADIVVEMSGPDWSVEG